MEWTIFNFLWIINWLQILSQFYGKSSVKFELKLYFHLTLWFFLFPFKGPGRRFRTFQRCQCWLFRPIYTNVWVWFCKHFNFYTIETMANLRYIGTNNDLFLQFCNSIIIRPMNTSKNVHINLPIFFSFYNCLPTPYPAC